MRGIFISYRRDDSAGYAGRLYDALAAHFSRDLVFIDIDSIRAGQDFVQVIDQQIAACSVVIVLIGKGWLSSTDARGVRRLDQPNDFVRLEVATALRQNKPLIPVLVGGARMPAASDLPAPLAPLAHINAVEIFDQLFPESVRHLLQELRPLVKPKPAIWRWSDPNLRRVRPWLVAAVLLTTVAIAAIVRSKSSPEPSGTRQPAHPPSETLVGPEDQGSPTTRVKVTMPSEVEELPPVVEASRNVITPGSSLQVTGPAMPRILGRANITVGDAWHVIGIAADGTVYLYDEERNALDAVRDGKEQWAYSAPDVRGFGAIGFAPDGRLWLGDYCFNSRGEGGLVKKKGLLPDRATLRPVASQQHNTYDCRDGQAYAMDPRGKKVWQVELDGNCGSLKIDPPTGNVYASSDARTLYAIAATGQQLWNVKQACMKSSVNIHPLPNDELIVACNNQPLYSLRHGRPLWTSTVGAAGDRSWSDVVFDASGNLYVGSEGPSIMTELISLDKSGNPRWTVPAGTPTTPQPIGFDPDGRLYVSVSEKIVILSSKDQ